MFHDSLRMDSFPNLGRERRFETDLSVYGLGLYLYVVDRTITFWDRNVWLVAQNVLFSSCLMMLYQVFRLRMRGLDG